MIPSHLRPRTRALDWTGITAGLLLAFSILATIATAAALIGGAS